MKHAAIASVLLVAINAQIPYNPKQNCTIVADIKPDPGPFYMFEPGKADCGAGWAVPFGPVPSGCAKLEVIVARGTSENGPIGQIVGDPLVARVIRDMKSINFTAQGYPVQYQADMVHMLVGVADVPKRMDAQIKACADIKFALIGYSQGGSVISLATATMPSNLTEKTVAVVLYGSGNGSSIVGSLRNRTIANCAPGDFACGDSKEGPGHTSYNEKGTIWHDRTSQYIVEQFQGKSLGGKTMRSPIDPL